MSNNSELEKIITYVQKLEKRLKQLESKEAIIVQGFLQNQQPKPLKISVDKLINLYNDIPHILTEYAIEVSLTSQSYRQKTLDRTIILEKVVKGNYWVILLENMEINNYYLLPNGNRKIKVYKLQTINNLFNLKGLKNSNEEEFTLIKPCQLNILSSGKEWEMKEKGELLIGKKSPLQNLTLELEKLTKNEKEIPASLQQLLNILSKINQGNSQLTKEIELLDHRLQNLEPTYSKLINLYSKNPDNFADLEGGYNKLKFTQDTINQFLQNNPDTINITLEVNPIGEYLLKKINGEEYLFPDPQILFDKMTLTLAHYTKLLLAENEIPIATVGKNIIIKKPAKLRKNGNIWTILESGKVHY
ncbi:hypothetical protein [Geminocystis herdmanii]|uniref:hypothetical protein n=1 Tax=Geminocystis herdmanii TaxID=669359 RepID=UPI00034AA7A2|nr:hypothetical protein [Geminocystis herdmanii]